MIEIPASRAGRRGFTLGDKIEIESTLLTHARGYRIEWKGEFALAR